MKGRKFNPRLFSLKKSVKNSFNSSTKSLPKSEDVAIIDKIIVWFIIQVGTKNYSKKFSNFYFNHTQYSLDEHFCEQLCIIAF